MPSSVKGKVSSPFVSTLGIRAILGAPLLALPECTLGSVMICGPSSQGTYNLPCSPISETCSAKGLLSIVIAAKDRWGIDWVSWLSLVPARPDCEGCRAHGVQQPSSVSIHIHCYLLLF